MKDKLIKCLLFEVALQHNKIVTSYYQLKKETFKNKEN